MILAIIQARVGSTRLPGKVMMNLEGKTVLERVIERVQASKYIDEVIVATTLKREDLEIVNVCAKNCVRVYCGSENNVLDRYFQIARTIKSDRIVRITADCPLIDPKIIDDIINKHMKVYDYASNIIERTYPDGEDVEIINSWVFETIYGRAMFGFLALDDYDKEHVTPFIIKNYRTQSIKMNTDLSKLRWTLDTKEDYKYIKSLYKKYYKKNPLFGMKEILDEPARIV
jgi:spore coat polysaccharide biosynthesis protein SpsF